MLNILRRNWWALALRGILALLFGILAFTWPGLALGALVLLFGTFAIYDGIFSIVAAFHAKGREERWWSELIVGLIGIAAGVVAFSRPGITTLFLLYLIAFWAIARGLFEIVAAFRLRKEIKDEWLLGLAGLASVVLGVLMLMYPGAGVLAFVWWIGAFAIFMGVLLLALSFRLRSLEHTLTHGLPHTA